MSLNDPIADMLTRIRNAVRNRAKTVECLNNKVCRGIASVLQSEGYVAAFEVLDDGRQGKIKLRLKYTEAGDPVIRLLTRESSPGCRVYRKVDDLPRPLQGLGISVVSTSHGVMSDRVAREENVGGELLCTVQ